MKQILIILIFGLATAVVNARADSIKRPKVEWLNVCSGFSKPLNLKWSDGSVKAINFNFGSKYFYQLGFTIAEGTHSRGANYELDSFHAGIGRRWQTNFMILAGFIGPSYNYGKVKIPFVEGLSSDLGYTDGWGTFSMLQIIFRHPHIPEFGLGTEIFTNFNRAINNYGIRFVLQVSDGR